MKACQGPCLPLQKGCSAGAASLLPVLHIRALSLPAHASYSASSPDCSHDTIPSDHHGSLELPGSACHPFRTAKGLLCRGCRVISSPSNELDSRSLFPVLHLQPGRSPLSATLCQHLGLPVRVSFPESLVLCLLRGSYVSSERRPCGGHQASCLLSLRHDAYPEAGQGHKILVASGDTKTVLPCCELSVSPFGRAGCLGMGGLMRAAIAAVIRESDCLASSTQSPAYMGQQRQL